MLSANLMTLSNFEVDPQETALLSSYDTRLTPRGVRRQTGLLEAALRIIVREGSSAVTHRSVVSEARASYGSVAYYFGSRKKLIRETLRFVAQQNVQALSESWKEIERHGTDVHAIATLVARHSTHQMIEDRRMGIVIHQLHMAAARDPSLRPIIRAWGRAYARIMRGTLCAIGSKNPAADAALLINAINGMVIGQLAIPRENFESEVLRPTLERLLIGIGQCSTVFSPKSLRRRKR